MVSRLVFAVALIVTASSAPQAHAARWTNQFVEFELPSNWQCRVEGEEWTCQSEDAGKQREAMMVLATKLKGERDTLENYKTYLSQPRTFKNPGGKTVTAKPKSTAERSLNGESWVDALYLNSEIPGFYTRYLATVSHGLGVLVTYSVQKEKEKKYAKQFDDMVSTLKVIGVAPTPANPNPIQTPPPGSTEGVTKGVSELLILIGLIAALALGVGVFFWKRNGRRSPDKTL